MLFCVKTPINKLYVFAMALLLAVTLAGCGGNGGGTAMTPTEPPVTPQPTPQERCEAASGRWNADMTCTSAEELEAERMALEEERMAMVAAMTKAAKTKAEAINAEAMGSIAAPFDSATATENYTVTSEHEDGAVVVDIAIPGAGDDDPEFMRADALPAIEGWDGSMYTLGPNDDGETEIVGVYTDITAPKATPFAMVAGQALNARDLDTSADENGNGNNTDDYTALTVNQDSAEVLAVVESAKFAASAAALLTFDSDDASTTDVDEAFETTGIYNGAMGMYRCDRSSDCTVALDADGKITAMSTGWVFMPDEGATSDVPDSDYLYYGFWVKKTDADGATTYNSVQTFSGANGVIMFPVNEMSNVSGSASYEGGAAGVYMKKTFTAAGEIETATSGTFSADVSLMANFGGNDVAVNKQFSIEGSVSNFALSGGEQNAWSVNLKAGFTQADNMFSGAANGGGAEAAWNGTFYGAAEETPATDDNAAKLAPAAVAGEFNAHFSNGHVAGAFGAHKQ